MRSRALGVDESFSIWKKIIFIAVFFTVTPIALGTSLFSFLTLSNAGGEKVEKPTRNLIQVPQPGISVYASLPSVLPSMSGEVLGLDARNEIIRQYLKKNESPLESYADFIVEAADKYELDYRLTTAIAMKESGLCHVIPEESYNCWGWGIHSKGIKKFNSYEEGIEEISRGLKENYLDKGYETVEEIMTKYAHPSSTTWAEGVTNYMEQMQ